MIECEDESEWWNIDCHNQPDHQPDHHHPDHHQPSFIDSPRSKWRQGKAPARPNSKPWGEMWRFCKTRKTRRRGWWMSGLDKLGGAGGYWRDDWRWCLPFLGRAERQLVEIRKVCRAPWTRRTTARRTWTNISKYISKYITNEHGKELQAENVHNHYRKSPEWGREPWPTRRSRGCSRGNRRQTLRPGVGAPIR